MERTDLLTQELFSPKRISQKFAKPENRIKYYNKKAEKLRQSIMYIDEPLKKNINILNAIFKGEKKLIFSKQFMLGKGFSFNVMTHFDTIDGKRVACIYYYAIMIDDIDNVTFIKLN